MWKGRFDEEKVLVFKSARGKTMSNIRQGDKVCGGGITIGSTCSGRGIIIGNASSSRGITIGNTDVYSPYPSPRDLPSLSLMSAAVCTIAQPKRATVILYY